MSFKEILHEHQQRIQRPDDAKGTSTTIGGMSVDLGGSQTVEVDDDTFLTETAQGRPRSEDAFEAHQLGQSAIAESIKNVVISQITGGEMAFPVPDADDEDVPDAVQELRELFRSLLDGPHFADDDWEDLVAAAVSDLVDIGNGYWEAIPPAAETADLPVASFKPVPAMSVQHNVDRHGGFKEDEPAYYQAPVHMAEGMFTTGGVTPVPLEKDELVTFRYPGSRRAGRAYPMSPMMQVKEWLELLMNSTTHHGRYYNDNEMPAGILQVMQATEPKIDDIQQQIKDARGDPRSAPVIGGEGPANWIELGGQAINLNVIEEQKWFIQLVLGAFGIPKQELALVEDVNRNTSETQQSMIYKRVTLPLTEAICKPVQTQVFSQFPAYQSLDQPFGFTLKFSDPDKERAQEEHYRQRFESGGLSYNEYRQELGEDPGDTVIDLDGTQIDYGEHPWPVVQWLLKDATGGEPPAGFEEPQADGDSDDEDEDDSSSE